MSSRRPLVAGNWKMHKTVERATSLVKDLIPSMADVESVGVLVCPPFVSLPAVAEAARASNVAVGAQHVHWEDEGAFTGEVSPPMLKPLCSHVVVGHSERRAMFGETDQTVNKRVHAGLGHGLTPIVCVGETLEENQAGETAEVVSRQVRAGLEGLDSQLARTLIIAYEPVWAIGTGKAATPEGANDVIAVVIRPALEHLYGGEVAEQVRVLYGGSIKPHNARDFFTQSDIDGGLVGGASLESESFGAIVKAAI